MQEERGEERETSHPTPSTGIFGGEGTLIPAPPADAVYDDLARHYDLIYADWEASMRRQGEVLSALLPSRGRILDVAAGIGTQALPLAALGFQVVARDLSEAAIRRLKREAAGRKLEIDAAPADMRSVGTTVDGQFDAIVCFDNSLPHLLTDDDIVTALSHLRGLLRPGAPLLVSVRDYHQVDRGSPSVHPYGERTRGRRAFRLAQTWRWYDEDRYETTMTVEERREGRWAPVLESRTRYYAIPLPRLLALFRRAGLRAERVREPSFYQPVIRGYPA